MADSPQTEPAAARSGAVRVAVPTVLCTPEPPDEPSDTSTGAPSFVSADAPPAPSGRGGGSATGNPRNKCALQPGHSLMDWIRLGNSGRDLTGVGGRLRPVGPAELAAHNTPGDAWLAVRGRVYNVTPYLPYHPGGPEELMRGAGADATQLFDNVHPWVNYDSLLAKCLVGPLRHDLPDADELFDSSAPSSKSDRLREPSKAQELVRKSMENLANRMTPVRKKITKGDESKSCAPSRVLQGLVQSADLPVSIGRRAAASSANESAGAPPPLRYDWIQTSLKLTVFVYTGPLANPGGHARLADGCLLLEVVTCGWLRTLKLEPEAELREPLHLRAFAESGKIEVSGHKSAAGVWARCGAVSLGAAERAAAPRAAPALVVRAGRVSHDTALLCVAPRAGPALVPLGHHVRVHRTIGDTECVRSYTPVGEGWGPGGDGSEALSALRLAVKRYDNGALSPHLAGLRVGDTLTLSGPYGNFQLQQLKAVTALYLVAGGAGVTPMLGLLRFMLARSSPRSERVHLLFFNKTEEDILFRANFEEMTKDDERLKVTHILSEAGSSWTGYRGRISTEILTKEFGEIGCAGECAHLACVCGPAEFTRAALRLLEGRGLGGGCVHAFTG